MPIKLGETAASMSAAIAKVMLGDALVWQPTPSGPVNYTITQKDALAFGTANVIWPAICRIDDTHFLVCHANATGTQGVAKTFSIDGAGEITQIDSYVYYTGVAYGNYLVRLDDAHFIVTYGGSSSRMSVLAVDGAYDITKTSETTTPNPAASVPSVAVIDSTHFILTYMDPSGDGQVTTYSVNESYALTPIDYLEYDTADANWPSIVIIDATHFMIAYSGVGADGFVKTFSIDANYDNITQLSSLEHDTANGTYNSLVKIDSTHYALAYCGNGTNGYITIFAIDGSYAISKVSSLEQDPLANAIWNRLVLIDATHLMLAYTGVDGDGFIKTFSIDGSYNVTEVDSLEFDTTAATYCSLCKLTDFDYALAYINASNAGVASSFTID